MGNCGVKIAPVPGATPSRQITSYHSTATTTKAIITYGELLKAIVAKLPGLSSEVRVQQIARVSITEACALRLREDILNLGYTDVRFAKVAGGNGLLIYVGLNTEVSLTKEVYPPEIGDSSDNRSHNDSNS